MKLIINDVIKFKPLYEKIKSQTLPIQLTYKMSKFFKGLDSDFDFYAQELKKLLDQYSEKDSSGAIMRDGENIRLKQSTLNEFNEAFNRLSNLEVDVPDVKFTVDELTDIKLTVEDFNAFLPFIDD